MKTIEAGGSCGYDAGIKFRERKRIAVVGTGRRTLALQIGPASIQARDAAVALLQAPRRRLPFTELAFTNTAYGPNRVRDATCVAVKIFRKIPGRIWFKDHPGQWVVERWFTRLERSPRLQKLRGHGCRYHFPLCSFLLSYFHVWNNLL